MLKQCKEEGDCPDKEMEKKAGEMTATQVDDFAGTKHKGLPGTKEALRKRFAKLVANFQTTLAATKKLSKKQNIKARRLHSTTLSELQASLKSSRSMSRMIKAT